MPSETRAAKRARLAEPEAEAEAEDPGKVGTGKIAAVCMSCRCFVILVGLKYWSSF